MLSRAILLSLATGALALGLAAGPALASAAAPGPVVVKFAPDPGTQTPPGGKPGKLGKTLKVTRAGPTVFGSSNFLPIFGGALGFSGFGAAVSQAINNPSSP